MILRETPVLLSEAPVNSSTSAISSEKLETPLRKCVCVRNCMHIAQSLTHNASLSETPTSAAGSLNYKTALVAGRWSADIVLGLTQ